MTFKRSKTTNEKQSNLNNHSKMEIKKKEKSNKLKQSPKIEQKDKELEKWKQDHFKFGKKPNPMAQAWKNFIFKKSITMGGRDKNRDLFEI